MIERFTNIEGHYPGSSVKFCRLNPTPSDLLSSGNSSWPPCRPAGSIVQCFLSGLSLRGVSCIAEIILVMRYVELRSNLHRMISVVKVRDAEIDCALHRFSISGNGIVIEPDSTAAEEILAQAVQQGGHQGPVRASTGHGSED